MYRGPGSVPELKGLEKKLQQELYQTAMREGMKRLGGFQSHWWLAIPVIIVFGIVRIGGFSGTIDAVIFAVATVSIGLFLGNRSIDKGREWLREQGYPKS